MSMTKGLKTFEDFCGRQGAGRGGGGENIGGFPGHEGQDGVEVFIGHDAVDDDEGVVFAGSDA